MVDAYHKNAQAKGFDNFQSLLSESPETNETLTITQRVWDDGSEKLAVAEEHRRATGLAEMEARQRQIREDRKHLGVNITRLQHEIRRKRKHSGN